MPPKVRELNGQLRKQGLVWRPGKGSHKVWYHPRFPEIEVTISGQDGDDAKAYQVLKVREALAKLASLIKHEEGPE